ncbi:MAG: amino acid ABC transporter ATP-binding protein [Lactobacillales bacterium]|jgi:polar amino acid transport system ATP-binding protein|nr:amino acid ABC transporter ATP-binding protein [Lactobacillales bacterium]
MSESSSLLKIHNLKKSYGDLEVLKGISFKIKKGEVVVIIGPSGCGKSTLLRCINGFEKISSGEVFLEDQLISNSQNWTEIRKRIGMVFQSYDLFPHRNILNNLILGPMKVLKEEKAKATKDANELLKRVGLFDKKFMYPRELSGGQKQRVAIARALIMKPEVMLFDEVTASLDPEMVREVLDLLLGLARSGNTMLIVTHEMNFAKAVADKVIFMDQGKIAEVGIAKEFFENPKTKRAQNFLRMFSFEDEKES